MKKRDLLRLAAVILAMAAVLLKSGACAQGAKEGIEYALGVLIPSLFPFMILTSLFTSTLRAPKPALFLLLSVLGGYPAAAAALAEFSKKEGFSQENAELILYTCVSPGISFLLGVIGKALPSRALLLALLLSVYLSEAILFAICMLLRRVKLSCAKLRQGGGFIGSAASAARSVLLLSALAVAFSAARAVGYSFGAGKLFACAFEWLGLSGSAGFCLPAALCEITGGVSLALQKGASLAFLAAILAFGGICVHVQIFTLLRGKLAFSVFKFYLIRLLHVLLCAGILFLLRFFIRPDALAFSSADAAVSHAAPFDLVPGSVALAALCAFFLATFKNGVEIRKRT